MQLAGQSGAWNLTLFSKIVPKIVLSSFDVCCYSLYFFTQTMRGIETSVQLNWSFQHALTVKMRFYAHPLVASKRLFHTSFGFIDFFICLLFLIFFSICLQNVLFVFLRLRMKIAMCHLHSPSRDWLKTSIAALQMFRKHLGQSITCAHTYLHTHTFIEIEFLVTRRTWAWPW